ncbi:RNA binding motif protein 11 isoform X2 [Salminus brasiliensis]|uniref:RNA binding motif protein 11 isoform X2 n=1 Tax=Salminus brasiliensis TaxID=930266 RepID=UPI003B835084
MLENQSEVDRTVFVSNLQSCVKEEILYELFLQAGPVRKVVIPRDRDGQQRSFGFVYYKHAEAVPYAIELLDGIWLYGRPISLKYPFGHPLQGCGASSPNLQNGLAGNSKLPPQDEHSWSDTVSGLPLDHFSPAMLPAQGPCWPAVSTPSSAAPQWPWLDSGYASWIPGSEEQSPACAMCRRRRTQSTTWRMESIAKAEEAMTGNTNARKDIKFQCNPDRERS